MSLGLKQFDPEGEAAETLESKIGVSVIRHCKCQQYKLNSNLKKINVNMYVASKKPAGNADALEAFFGCSTKQLVMVSGFVPRIPHVGMFQCQVFVSGW